MSTTTTTTALLRSLPRVTTQRTAHRTFSSTPTQHSQIGKLPLTIPSGVTLHLPPSLTLPSSIPPTSASARRSIRITGPLGEHVLPISSAIVLQPPSSFIPSSSSSGTITAGSLSLSVQDPTTKSQKALWGLTRALLANALTGVSEGYRLALRLVGVGYRANVEEIPESLRSIASRIPKRAAASSKLNTDEPSLAPPTHRLNMKLGYAHPIYIDIPSDITVTTPQPTRIVLSGTDKQRLGLFAAKIRRWRKPEPYRGKVSSSELEGTHIVCGADCFACVGYLCWRRNDQAQGNQEEVIWQSRALYFRTAYDQQLPSSAFGLLNSRRGRRHLSERPYSCLDRRAQSARIKAEPFHRYKQTSSLTWTTKRYMTHQITVVEETSSLAETITLAGCEREPRHSRGDGRRPNAQSVYK